MRTTRVLSGFAAASLLLSSLPVVAQTSDSSASSASSSATSREAVRVERCKRFSRGDDYERCVRLIQRLPARGSSASSSSSSSPAEPLDENDKEWKWTNILNRMEAKIEGTIKLASVMGKKFCKDRTAENETTSRECMIRLREGMQSRVDRILDEVFRVDLPSAR